MRERWSVSFYGDFLCAQDPPILFCGPLLIWLFAGGLGIGIPVGETMDLEVSHMPL